MMWAYFIMIVLAALAGAGVFATGVYCGMFMMSVAYSDAADDDSTASDWGM